MSETDAETRLRECAEYLEGFGVTEVSKHKDAAAMRDVLALVASQREQLRTLQQEAATGEEYRDVLREQIAALTAERDALRMELAKFDVLMAEKESARAAATYGMGQMRVCRDGLAGELDAIKAERDRWREAQTWQPIATAPKDGITVVGLTPNESILVGDVFYSPTLEQWSRLPDADRCVRPTHWMPMPPAPKET